MNVASLNLCEELYELSGWEATDYWRYPAPYGVHRDDEVSTLGVHMDVKPICPAYDAGFLLRKLHTGSVRIEVMPSGYWCAIAYEYGNMQTADTPENALCQLAIELFEQGILKREGTDD